MTMPSPKKTCFLAREATPTAERGLDAPEALTGPAGPLMTPISSRAPVPWEELHPRLVFSILRICFQHERQSGTLSNSAVHAGGRGRLLRPGASQASRQVAPRGLRRASPRAGASPGRQPCGGGRVTGLLGPTVPESSGFTALSQHVPGENNFPWGQL